jgi:RHS repeat-associated protein
VPGCKKFFENEKQGCLRCAEKNGFLFELPNHLGNVLVTISDRKVPNNTTIGQTITYFKPVVITANDYYPFGMIMPGRNYNNGNAKDYKYGFNGKENDNEVKGEGNVVAFEARIYDSRLGRFLSTDPREKDYAWQSTYAYFGNSPISILDIKGEGGENPGVHVVSKGENLTSIANKHHTTVQAILALDANKKFKNRVNLVKVGEEIALPDRATDASGFLFVEQAKKIDFSKQNHFKLEGNDLDYTVAQASNFGRPNVGFNEVVRRFENFVNGTGPTNLVYTIYNQITHDVKNHYLVNNAREAFYKKFNIIFRGTGSIDTREGHLDVKKLRQAQLFFENLARVGLASYTNHAVKWTPLDVFKTKTWGMQFVGSCSISIYASSDAQRLIFVAANSTSRWSYRFHNASNIPRTTPMGGAPESTILNLFIWTEPLYYFKLSVGAKPYEQR